MTTTNTKKPQGLATLSPERRREIASIGGKASHRMGRAHKWTPEEAAGAARKGVEARLRKAKRFREEV